MAKRGRTAAAAWSIRLPSRPEAIQSSRACRVEPSRSGRRIGPCREVATNRSWRTSKARTVRSCGAHHRWNLRRRFRAQYLRNGGRAAGLGHRRPVGSRQPSPRRFSAGHATGQRYAGSMPIVACTGGERCRVSGQDGMRVWQRVLHLRSHGLQRTIHFVDLYHARHARSRLSCIATCGRDDLLDLTARMYLLRDGWAAVGHLYGSRLAIGIRADTLPLTAGGGRGSR
jgi:hypothetical protein